MKTSKDILTFFTSVIMFLSISTVCYGSGTCDSVADDWVGPEKFDHSDGSYPTDGHHIYSYFVYKGGYIAGANTSLILGLHGNNGNAQGYAVGDRFSPPKTQLCDIVKAEKADGNSVLVVFPDGYRRGEAPAAFLAGKSWHAFRCCDPADADGGDGVNSIGYLKGLIEEIDRIYDIDRSRVYATGFSNGGGMVQRLACEAPDYVASVWSVSFPMNAHSADTCQPGVAITTAEWVGDQDKVVLPDTYVVPEDGPEGGHNTAEGSFEQWAYYNNCDTAGGTPETFDLAPNVTCYNHTDCDYNQIDPTNEIPTQVQLCRVSDGLHNAYKKTDVIDSHSWSIAKNYTVGNTGGGGVSPNPEGRDNNPPIFNDDPITKASAAENIAYTGQTLAGEATDPDNDTLEYIKKSGPAWLTVASDGMLGGLPSSGDVGLNQFVVEVSDDQDSAQVSLQITVDTNTSGILFEEGIENGLNAWTTIGSVKTSTISYSGRYSARMRQTASMTTDIYTEGQSSVTISFAFKAYGLNNGEYCYAEYSLDGTTWTTLSATNSALWQLVKANVSMDASNILSLRFRSNASKYYEYGYVDDVRVE